jgi:hypothetical protein
MKRQIAAESLLITVLAVSSAHAAPPVLIAIGTVSPTYEDFATQTAGPLENGIPGNRLGGLGSGLAYLGGDFFVALPDRGPNAKPYAGCLDDTASYINRFHTLHMSLAPSDAGAALPFTLTPMLVGTTLLSSSLPLVYGAGCGGAGSGVPALNALDHTYYFTGRSDNFDPERVSTNPHDGRFDPEGVRVSNDRRHVYISDEYGPYVYEFDRLTGERTRVFTLPARFAIGNLSSAGDDEISGNTSGRVANKGMEGLAITPDGRTLVGAMQSPLLQDGGTDTGENIRLVAIDIKSGATREYAYHLDSVKTTVSEILALNDHEFLLDERDSKGLADTATSVAVIKKLYRIGLNGAAEVGGISGNANLAAKAVSKELFLDIVSALNSNGIASHDIPAKLEGIAFGQDVAIGGETKHTLYVSNDNDYTSVVPNVNHPNGSAENPNAFFVFAFDEAELPGFVPQRFKRVDDDHRDRDHDRRDR